MAGPKMSLCSNEGGSTMEYFISAQHGEKRMASLYLICCIQEKEL